MKTIPNSLPPIGLKKQHVAKLPCTFHQFFAMWMEYKQWEIPDFHIEVLDFLSDYKNWENNTGLLQVFRGGAKSTIVALYITWMLTQDPTLRFLVLSADKKTAGKITTDIATIVRQHPWAKHLHGDEGAWRSDMLVVEGAVDGRNPSVTSWGVMSNITGSRADFIIYDDTEVPKNSRTSEDREKLRTKLDEPTHILVPGGYELFIGTPHSHDSIYTELAGESTKEDPFRSGCTQIKIPLMKDVQGEFPNMTGIPTWPERFSMKEIIKRQKGSATKGHFLSQYLLLPYNPEDTVLDPTLISRYEGDLRVHQANGGALAQLCDQRIVAVSCFWDPSMAKVSTDDSILAIVYSTEDGHYYIHRTVKLKGDASEQIEEVMRVMKDNFVTHVIIETNGIGNFLPALFRKAAEGKGITCDGKATTQNKIEKILEAYETRLSAGYLHAHRSVLDSPFRNQLRDFSGRYRGKDDYIDAVAMCILSTPIRIKHGSAGNRFTNWNSLGGSMECPQEAVTF